MKDSEIRTPVCVLGAEAVCGRLGISRAGLWRLMQRDDFPTPIRFLPSSRAHLKFFEHEISAWLNAQRALTTTAVEAGGNSLGIHLSR
jgi:predicted DNA-binding transcriptional regulator AlpA